MNKLGPDGCVRERASIVAKITANYDALPWWNKVKAVGNIVTGLPWTIISPRDPIGLLVDEAIRRARAAMAS